ncbi:hypothetical protein BGZ83_003558, partial [Gryganskiella cystojenkinii]
ISSSYGHLQSEDIVRKAGLFTHLVSTNIKMAMNGSVDGLESRTSIAPSTVGGEREDQDMEVAERSGPSDSDN